MHRFFLPPELLESTTIEFPPETAHQMVSVLRLKVWDHVIVLCGDGREAKVKLTAVNREQVKGDIVGWRDAPCEPRIRLTLYLALTQREKFEWMLQKGTEVGASAFVPMLCERALVKDATEVDRKRERWETILKEAAEQSRRGRIPLLHPVQTIQEISQADHPVLVAWESDTSHGVRDVVASLKRPTELGVVIGPEGGITDKEADHLIKGGAQPFSLGKRILRMETAAVVAAALVLHELGEMSPEA